ncbi:MAG: hypothetical protein V1800_06750 [Candidatus Latescibacterota bacterium]
MICPASGLHVSRKDKRYDKDYGLFACTCGLALVVDVDKDAIPEHDIEEGLEETEESSLGELAKLFQPDDLERIVGVITFLNGYDARRAANGITNVSGEMQQWLEDLGKRIEQVLEKIAN